MKKEAIFILNCPDSNKVKYPETGKPTDTKKVRDTERLVDLKKEIAEALSRIPDANCRIITEKKYIGYMKNAEIAREMHYSVIWIRKQHQKGLMMTEKIMPEKQTNSKSVSHSIR